MSRNASGTYTLPSGNPVVSGTLIEATWANDTLSDLASAMTDSLSRSGQGGMTAALRLYDGTSSVPGLAWGSETTSGWYRAGAGDMRLVITGSEVMKYLATGVAVTGTLSATGNTTVGGTLGVTGATTLTGALTINGGIANNPTITAGTANGVAYLNGSKVLTTGSALTFDGTVLSVNGGTNGSRLSVRGTGAFGGFDTGSANDGRIEYAYNGTNTFYTGIDSSSLFTLMARSGVSLAFGANGSEGMRLTSTGLGIGTSSPSQKLDISAGQIYFSSTSAGNLLSNDSYVNIGQLYSSGGAYIGYGAKADPANASAYVSATTVGIGRAAIDLGAGGTGVFRVFTGTGETTAVGSPLVNMVERARIDTSGNLGLGVTPSAWLSSFRALQLGQGSSLWGASTGNNAGFDSNVYVNTSGGSIYIGSTYATRYQQNDGAHKWFNAPSGTAGNAISFTQAMTLDASGNWLLGQTSSIYSAVGRASAEINGGLTAIYAMNIANSNAGYIYHDGTNMSVLNYRSGHLAFATNNTERARIDSSGAFIVGSTGTNRGVGNLSINPNTSNGAADITFNRNSTTSTSYVVGFQNAGSTVGYIAYNNTTTTYATSSDARLKENEALADDAGAVVDSIVIRKFDWKVDGSHQRYGVIAQELQTVYPEAVAVPEDETKMMGVDYSKLVPLLVKEIQSLRARVTQLEGA